MFGNIIDFLKLLPIWVLLVINFCQCVHTTLSPELRGNSTYITTHAKTQYLFSPHFHKIISGIYQQNFDNFNKVLNFAEISNDYIFKVDALLELYKAMSDAKHTKNPINAMYLYQEIETVINLNSEGLNVGKLNKLQTIRQELLSKAIVPKGSQILEDAVYTNDFIQKETKVGKFIELLHLNDTLSSLTTKRMVKNLHWMPIAELLPILTNLFSCAQQNIDLLLSLNDVYPMQESEQNDLFLNLLSLEEFLSNNISSERKRKLDAIIPKAMRALHGGRVCFYQESTSAQRNYITCFSRCTLTFASGSPFAVQIREKPTLFTFYNGDLFSVESGKFGGLYIGWRQNRIGDVGWKVIYEGEKVLLQNMNNTMYLCTSGAEYSNDILIRTQENFPLHADSCKWFVAEC